MNLKTFTFWGTIFILAFAHSGLGQNTVEKAKNILSQAGTAPIDLKGIILSHAHESKNSGITHIYLKQQINGIDILGAVGSVHLNTSGELVAFNNDFVPNAASKVASFQPMLSAGQALEKVLIDLELEWKNPLIEISRKENPAKETLFSKTGISKEDVPVKLCFFSNNNQMPTLAWDTQIYSLDGSQYWVVQVDANSGKILNKKDRVHQCNFENCGSEFHTKTSNPINTNQMRILKPNPAVLAGSYRVFDTPLANPTEGARTLIADPEDPIASPFGWHDTDGVAGAEFTITRGNNIHAYDDGNNPDYSPDGGAGLVFDFPLDLNGDPETYEDAAITNAFYVTNLCHDILYQYGFDEAAGNFQENNYGNGGTGSDYVNVEVQDFAGTCNANMLTQEEGLNPFMQLYLCNGRDIAYSNSIIIHEYVHGLTNRLTGGANDVNCLDNAEQMGEGWSDWYSLMFTMKSGDKGSDPIYYANWALNNAEGIRTFPYSTDLNINPHTYDDIKIEGGSHGVGAVWCAMLWDMTWFLIDTHGFDPDLINGTGGNNIALDIVTEALKLQSCDPGFVDARDAILQADQNINGGANECLIWEAFARRGLGDSADQGSRYSRFDGVSAFDLPTSCNLSFSKEDNPGFVQPGSITTYTLKVTNNTNGTVQNIDLSDDIPANTTYVAGSASNGGSLQGGTVVFPTINSLSSGSMETRSFQVQTSNSLPSHNIVFEDDMENGEGNWDKDFPWAIAANYQSSGNAFRISSNLSSTCARLEMKNSVAIGANMELKFRHYYLFLNSFSFVYNGAFVEISTDGGGTWQTLDNHFTKKGYDEIYNSPGNACNHSDGIFNGTGGTYIESVVDLSNFNGQNALFRFSVVANTPFSDLCRWYIDHVTIGTFSEIHNIANLKADGFCKYATLSPPTIVTNNVPPSNDECAGAFAAAVNANMVCGTMTSGTTNFSTESETDCSSGNTKDVWFSFQATHVKHRFDIQNNANPLGMELYSGTCGSLTSLQCDNSDDGFNQDNLNIGNTYYIRIFTQNGNSTSSFDLCIRSFPPPPANDECTGAVSLNVNIDGSCTLETSSTTLSATQSLPDCSGGNVEDVWFTFTALGTENTFEFSNLTAIYGNPNPLDLGFEVFSGDCNNLTSISCISSLANNQTILGFTPGNDYFIRVFTGGTGLHEEPLNFNICVKSSLPNDECVYAIVVVVNLDDNCANTTPATTINATQSETACNGTNSTDSWYQFTATSIIHEVSILNTVHTVGIEIYEGNCVGLISLGCNENGTIQYNNFTIGNTYFIRTYTPNGGTPTNFDLCVKSPVPTNDDCANAISATVNGDLNCGTTHNGTTWNATASSPIPGCAGGTVRDVWFSFSATANEHRITLSNTSSSTGIEVMSGSCGTLTSLDCQITTSLDLSNLTTSTTYYIRIFTLTSNSPTDFTLCIGTLPPPSNDDCSGALSLVVNGNGVCANTMAGTTSNATNSAEGCVTNNVRDVWFSFVATDTRHQIEILNIVGTINYELLEGDCNNLTVKDCPVLTTFFYNDFVIGNTYYIKVYSTGSNNPASFDVCVSTPPAPANNECATATVATVNADPNCTIVNSGTTLFAGQSSTSCFGSSVFDVWYIFNALDADVEIILSNTSAFFGLEVYDGSCNNLTSIGCDETFAQLTIMGLTVGNDYYIRVFSMDVGGTFDLCIREITPAPANDDCANLVTIAVNQNIGCAQTTSGTTIAATQSELGCFGEFTQDVWYDFTATHTDHYIDYLNVVGQNGGFVGLGFELYDGNCGLLNSLFCIDDVSFNNQTLTGLSVGTQYIVRSFTTDIGDAADFEICARLPGALPVEWVFFNAKRKDEDAVLLEWATAFESENAGFDIQKSQDLRDWENIGFVNGYAYSDTQKAYHFIDDQPFFGLNYYRLKQNDFAGKVRYSTIETVHYYENNASGKIQISPNPTNDYLQLFVPQNDSEKRVLKIEIWDNLGRQVKRLASQKSKTELNVSALTAGVYWIIVKSENSFFDTIRFVKL